MKVGIVIVNYNKKELLRGCLVSLRSVAYDDFQIVVVDNGSSDGSQDFVKKEFPSTKVIDLGYNSGFCKANNVGIGYCLRLGCEAVLLLNNDTEVDPHFLAEMVSAFDTDDVGMVAPKILFLRRKNVIDSVGLVITPDGLAKNRGLEKSEKEFILRDEVFCPAGAAALYKKELLEDIVENGQYLDESFGYYFEELDLGWRARLRGWKSVYVPSARVYHLKSATAGAYSEFVAYYTNRNIFYNIIKNYPEYFMPKALFLSILRYPLLFIGFALNKGAGNKIKNEIGIKKMVGVSIRSFFDAVKNINKMLAKRKIIQRNKTVNNKEIRRWFRKLGLAFPDSLYK